MRLLATQHRATIAGGSTPATSNSGGEEYPASSPDVQNGMSSSEPPPAPAATGTGLLKSEVSAGTSGAGA